MFGLVRLFFMGFIVLTVIYVCLSFYSRAQRRSKLEAQWNLEGLDDQNTRGDQDDYVQKGLEEYDDSVRRKLILGVYIVPITLMCVTIYLTNFA